MKLSLTLLLVRLLQKVLLNLDLQLYIGGKEMDLLHIKYGDLGKNKKLPKGFKLNPEK